MVLVTLFFMAGLCLAKDACSLLTKQEASELIGAIDHFGDSRIQSSWRDLLRVRRRERCRDPIVLHDRSKARELKRCADTGQGQTQVSGSPEPACMVINGPVVSVSAAKGEVVATIAVFSQKTD
jgi:hypothetical protein